MKTVSNEFRQKIYNGAQFYQEAKIVFADGREKELGKKDFYISGNSYSDGPGTNAFPLGEAMSKHITMSLVNDDDRFSDYDFYMAKITVWLKCDLSETTESILLGIYTVTTPENYGSSVTVEALDDMYKGDEEYTTELIFPATIGVILRDSCSKVGVSLLSTTFSNDSFVIQNKPEDITHRQLWGMIAMLAGGNARMDENNYLKIVEYDFSVFEGTGLEEGKLDALENVHYFKRIKTPTIATDDVVITGVQTTVGETKHLVGEEGYVLSLENQLLEESPDEALKFIGNKVVGLQFRPFTIDHVAYPLAEFGDICYVEDRKGNIYQSVVTDVNFTYFSYTNITCATDDPVRNSSKYNSSMAETIRKSRKETKIQISEYDLVVQQLTNLITNSFGVFKTEKVQEDGSIIHYMHNKPELESSSIIWKMTANTFSVSSDGGKTWNAGLDSEGNAVVNVLNAIGINADWILTGILADRAGKSFWNMETGEAVFGGGTKLNGKSVDEIIGAAEKAEQAIISVRVEYALGDATDIAPSEGWLDEAPQWEDGKYMWQRTTTEYVDGSTETTSPTCISGATGQSGTDGVGVSSIQQYYLATASSSGVTTDTTGWTTGVQAINSIKKYLWNCEEITYTDDTKTRTTPCIIGAYGDTGADGKDGVDGIGIKSIIEQYYLSSSNTTQTGGTWSNTCPAWKSGYYIWARSYITWTDGTTTTTTPVLANGINTANTNAMAAVNKAMLHYGTCATAAATVAKTVTLSGFSLYKGATVSILFTYANTATNPTLNVNGTGAKNIRVNGVNISKKFYWRASNTLTFVYDGTYWVMSDTCANTILADWCDENDVTLINGGMLATHSVTANKISVDDLIAFEATIGGWEITEDGLTKIGTAFILPTAEDVDMIKNASLGTVTLTATQKIAADINCDGNINITDFMAWKAILLGKGTLDDYPKYIPIKSDIYMEINPNDAEKTIRLYGTNSFGTEVESFYGINSLKTQTVNASGGYFGKVRVGEITTDAGANLDELNSKLSGIELTTVTITAAASANAYVSPYTHYGTVSLASYVSKYGIPVRASALGGSGIPTPCHLRTDNVAVIVSNTASPTLVVTFMGGVTQTIV